MCLVAASGTAVSCMPPVRKRQAVSQDHVPLLNSGQLERLSLRLCLYSLRNASQLKRCPHNAFPGEVQHHRIWKQVTVGMCVSMKTQEILLWIQDWRPARGRRGRPQRSSQVACLGCTPQLPWSWAYGSWEEDRGSLGSLAFYQVMLHQLVLCSFLETFSYGVCSSMIHIHVCIWIHFFNWNQLKRIIEEDFLLFHVSTEWRLKTFGKLKIETWRIMRQISSGHT